MEVARSYRRYNSVEQKMY